MIIKKSNKNKFNATATRVDGILFASKLEASYYCYLKILKRIGEVKYWLCQPPFILPGGRKYRCDFQVFYANGTVEYVDVKGRETEGFKLKKSIVENLYPVEIKIVKKGDF